MLSHQPSTIRHIEALNTLCTPRVVLYMVAIRRCHLARMTVWIIPCRCMQLRRSAMNCLPTAIQSCMTSQQQACASLPFMAHKQLVPMQPGDVPTTYADATALERDFGFTPKITLREGLRKFAEWYKSYYCSDV